MAFTAPILGTGGASGPALRGGAAGQDSFLACGSFLPVLRVAALLAALVAAVGLGRMTA